MVILTGVRTGEIRRVHPCGHVEAWSTSQSVLRIEMGLAEGPINLCNYPF